MTVSNAPPPNVIDLRQDTAAFAHGFDDAAGVARLVALFSPV